MNAVHVFPSLPPLVRAADVAVQTAPVVGVTPLTLPDLLPRSGAALPRLDHRADIEHDFVEHDIRGAY